MKIALVSTYDINKHNTFLVFTRNNKLEYCKHHGYAYFEYPNFNDTVNRPYLSWLKLKVLLLSLTEHSDYDWFFWCDVDNLITNIFHPLEYIIQRWGNPNTCFIMAAYISPHRLLVPSRYYTNYNPLTSAFLVRNCSLSRTLLEYIYSAEQFKTNEFTLYSNHVYEELAFGLMLKQMPEVNKYFSIVPAEVFTSVAYEQIEMGEEVGFPNYHSSSFILSTYRYNVTNILSEIDKAYILKKYYDKQ